MPMTLLVLIWLFAPQEAASIGEGLSIPRVPPRGPSASLDSMHCHDGFEMQLLAAEPLVNDPVAIEYDEFGRAWVAEMRDYPFTDKANDKPFTEKITDLPLGRIRVLEDLTGDGVFDRSTIFADNLSWPTGLAFWRGGIYVVATPELLYLKDTDGDLKADVRETVISGFRKFNVQAVINNLKWGDDHWLYGAGSSNGGSLRLSGSKDESPLVMSAGDFRFRPHSPDSVELLAGGARFGNTFDDWGHRFICNIRNPIQQIVIPRGILARNPDALYAAVVHDVAVSGDQIPVWRKSAPEAWRVANAARLASDAKLASPRSESVASGYMTSASGATVYRGDAYPPEYYGTVFLGEVAGNLIHHQQLERAGTAFRSSRTIERGEFVASEDNWFRPTNFVNAPDGTLHVTDMYRETIEHPWSMPDDIKAALDLENGRDRGRIYRLAPRGFQMSRIPRLGEESTANLVAFLSHPRSWCRDTAHRLIFERQDSEAVELLQQLIRNPEPSKAVGRRLALWSLEGLNALRPEDVMVGLQDPHPGVRITAVVLAERFLKTSHDGPDAGLDSRPLTSDVLELASDPDIEVRMQVGIVAWTIINGSTNTSLNNSVIAAMATIAARDSDDPYIRNVILSSSHGVEVELVEAMLRSADSYTPGFSLLIQELSAATAKSVASVQIDSTVKSPETISLSRLSPLRRLSQLSRLAADNPSATLTDRQRALIAGSITIGVAEGTRRAGKDVASVLSSIPEHGSDVFEREIEHSLSLLENSVQLDLSNPETVVQLEQATRLLQYVTFSVGMPYFKSGLELNRAAESQVAAVRALAGYREAEIPELILVDYRQRRPEVRREIVDALLSRPEWHPALMTAVEAGTVAVFDVPHLRRNVLLRSSNPDVQAKALQIFSAAIAARQEVVQKYRQEIATLKGDQQRGDVVFRRECQHCHRAGVTGQQTGPNLSTIRNRARDEVLLHILDPNREVAPNYVAQLVVLNDGQQLAGIITDETASQLTILQSNGTATIVGREQIEEVVSQNQSLMPVGLEQKITPSEMTDLLSFLLD
ncbi:MAG: c-type cytochrome [Planctomyces sp.]|nr:c-type cytochrome [Planctomyces sp.]